jgi:hypothetical protein
LEFAGFEEFCVGFGRNPSKWVLLRSEECGGGSWRRLLACLLVLSVCMAEEDKGTATKKKSNRGALLSLMEYWV